MHYYNFHIGDYVTHTKHLSLIEDLAFRRLLDFYYLHEKPIRQHEIARQVGMREHEQEVFSVLEEFFVSTENGYINPRADREIAKFKEMSEGGKRGAAIRWAKGSHSPPNAPLIATNNQEPITNNKKSADAPVSVDNLVWQDFLKIRKAKRAPLTQTALEAIQREADKAGWALNDAIRECVTRGWQGFKADWVEKRTQAGPDLGLQKIKQDLALAAPMPSHIRETLAKLKGRP